jgi:hypothetical protein
VLTYYLGEGYKTQAKARREREKELFDKGQGVTYPSWESLRDESREEDPVILLTVSDAEGHVVRRITGPAEAGFHRIAWDLRLPPAVPTELSPSTDYNPFQDPPMGPLAVPGAYTVAMAKRVGGKLTPLGPPQRFDAVPLGAGGLAPEERAALLDFQKKTARLQRAVLGAGAAAEEAQTRLSHLKAALHDTPAAEVALAERARALELRLDDLRLALEGNEVRRAKNEPDPPSITDRVQGIVAGHWLSTSAPTQTHRSAYDLAAKEFAPVLEGLRTLIDEDLRRLEGEADAAGAPWTPGRVPLWTGD